MSKLMWKFHTRHFTVHWSITPDVLDTVYFDPELAKETRQKVRSGQWKCFMSTIEVIDRGTGAVLGEAYLGNSIYDDPAKFRDHFGMRTKGYGSYFSDMVREAIRDARSRFPLHVQREAERIEKIKAALERMEQFQTVQLRTTPLTA